MSAILERNLPPVLSVIEAQCNRCTRKHKGKISCEAFKEIPTEILNNSFIHTKPFPGDNGILFNPKKK